MTTIDIDNESCIKCSKCVKVCPAYILTQESAKAEINVRNVQTCIGCGHCVAVCPTDSVIHSLFPQEKVHTLNRDIIPSPEQVMELCKARRSNRAFLSSPVPESYLRQIVEAAHLAPTASNGQEVSFTLVTNPDLLKQVSDITIDTFEATVKKISNPLIKPFLGLISPEAKGAASKLNAVIAKHKSGTDAILRGAKAILFIHTPSTANFGRQDSNLAYQNASLMAESLGVSQFYTGYVCIAIDLDKKKKLAKLLNIEGNIHAGMALSMPAFKFPKYTDREDLKLTIF
ncbi:nitroreductase family protein [Dysgonomonas sp. BGC7]|uniref:nitroreductase family protein n=1 Tax=Dysgonomonas sp. BGC7 TaxID=1658008 RepID=UPI00068121BD|nr:nitroreductase family protein [Dysgonomonas sp. BGC7]MBD8387644.1 nitroreductase family protein [Dysgonomonas sp. BGC7]